MTPQQGNNPTGGNLAGAHTPKQLVGGNTDGKPRQPDEWKLTRIGRGRYRIDGTNLLVRKVDGHRLWVVQHEGETIAYGASLREALATWAPPVSLYRQPRFTKRLRDKNRSDT